MKKVIAIVAACLCAVALTGCEGGMQLMDTTYKFDRAIICLPDGTKIEGKCDSWLDYENSDVIQVKIDGVTYLTHYSNVILIAE